MAGGEGGVGGEEDRLRTRHGQHQRESAEEGFFEVCSHLVSFSEVWVNSFAGYGWAWSCVGSDGDDIEKLSKVTEMASSEPLLF